MHNHAPADKPQLNFRQERPNGPVWFGRSQSSTARVKKPCASCYDAERDCTLVRGAIHLAAIREKVV